MTDATVVALPRVVPDTQCDSYVTALKEAKRRSTGATTSAVTRIRKSPYGGYIVVSIPAKAMAMAARTAGGSELIRSVSRFSEEYLDE